jgi:ubiquinone/menaquinone biosynthesis C-methylase UbiE
MKLLANWIPRRTKRSHIGLANQNTRDEWLEKTLSTIPCGLSILDAGAGECQYKKWCRHLQYTSQDFNQYTGKDSAVGLQMSSWNNTGIDIVCDVAEMPLADETFDVVMCTEVLEHVPNPVKVIRELSRVLKQGGMLIVTAPFNSLTHFAPFHFATGFNRFFYEHHLKALHHEIIEMSVNGNYFEYIAQETRRLPDVISKYAPSQAKRIPALASLLENVRVIMDEIQQHSVASEELLCFGYHVRSRKR